MFAAEGKGRGYYSAASTPPDMSLTNEFILNSVPYIGGYFALKHLSRMNISQPGGNTYYDLIQKQIRNTANTLPFTFGVMNTFRIPEFMSPYLSAKALGLQEGGSVLDGTKNIGFFEWDSKHFLNKETLISLEETVGSENFQKAKDVLNLGILDRQFKLRYEQDLKATGRGSLFLQAFDLNNKLIETMKLSDDVAVMNLAYQADTSDILENANVEQKTNPAFVSVQQSLEVPSKLDKKQNALNKLYAESDEFGQIVSKAKLGVIPSVEGDASSLNAIKRRTAYPTSYLNFGLNRFNRLLSATAEQVPILGDRVGGVFDKLGLSLRTTPGPFYKQFFELGFRASKLTAAYMTVETVDHYRRKFDTPGHLAISAGLAFGAGKLYEHLTDSATRSFKTSHVAGAAFALQMLPGFSEGIVPGIATAITSLDVGKSYLGLATGMSFYRRGIEGLFPGISDPSIGIGVGVAAAIAAYKGVGEKRLLNKEAFITPDWFRNRYGFMDVEDSTGTKLNIHADIDKISLTGNVDLEKNKILYDIFVDENSELFKKYNPILNDSVDRTKIDPKIVTSYFDKLKDFMGTKDWTTATSSDKSVFDKFIYKVEDLFGTNIPSAERKIKILDFENTVHALAKTQAYDVDTSGNFLNFSLLNRIENIKQKYSLAPPSFMNPIFERGEIFATEVYHAFHGASMAGDVFDKAARSIDYTPVFRRMGTVAAGGFLIHQLLTGALFGSMENPSELKEIYSGKKLVEVKRGRFWEGGGTPYEGGDLDYARQHAYYLMMNRAEDKAVWGEEDEEYNPFTKFFLKNFTYHLERKNYYNRPYPITGTAFEDVPVIGGILSNTIGRLIKPAKIMHQEEFMRVNENNELEYYYPQEVGSSAQAAGTTPSGPPISPYSFGMFAGKVQYQFREIEGLTGWVKNMVQKASTGREVYGTRYPVMASSSQMDSPISSFWEKELGGMMFLSEPIRRLLPRPRKEIEQYNPILNTMPSWIPDKLRRGDPYRKIQSGFARLPGDAYAELYPELKGLDPEDYPLIHRYKILSDVDPTSRETLSLRNQLFERRAAGITTDYENRMLDQVVEMHSKKLSFQEFEGYDNAINIPIVSNFTKQLYAGLKEGVRTVAQPAEYLIPAGFRPVQKILGGERSAIDQYEYQRLYGTQAAFWDEPFRDWFRPAFYSALNMMGWEGKPMYVRQREEVDQTFEKLNFYKNMQLAMNAQSGFERKKFLAMASRTRMGVNPNGDPMSIYMALPEEERKFFNSFSNAKGSDRERILEMIPTDQKVLYESIWNNIDNGIDPSSLIEEKPSFDESYLTSQYDSLDMTNIPMPEPDWVGWNKDIDVNDIKIKYVDESAGDMRDYDLWESQARRVRRNNALMNSHEFMYEKPLMTRDNVISDLNYANPYVRNVARNLVVNNTTDYQTRAKLLYNDYRQNEIDSILQDYKGR